MNPNKSLHVTSQPLAKKKKKKNYFNFWNMSLAVVHVHLVKHKSKVLVCVLVSWLPLQQGHGWLQGVEGTSSVVK